MPLDPMIAQVLEMGRAFPPAETLPVAVARANMDARVEMLRSFAPADVSVRDLMIEGDAGPLPVRLYHLPGVAAPMPVLVWLHGGGWVLGSIDSHDNVCRYLAKEGGLLVVNVGYRLAPEHRAPAQQADSMAALRWAMANAAAHGGDPARLVVGGDSAGGNLAALAAIAARAAGPRLAGQLLVYPVTDPPADAMASYAANDAFGLTRSAMEWYWKQWLPEGGGADAGTAPLRATDLSGLPPAYVMTAEYDVLRDEGAAFAARLAEAGTETAHEDVPGVIHGFFSLPGFAPVATDAVRRAARWVAALAPAS